MTSPLSPSSDLSHLAPCMRCGTMNGVSARWCWRCDATLAQGGPHLPRTVPSAVFVTLTDALPDPAPLIEHALEFEPIDPPAAAAAHARPPSRFDHGEPPLLTEAVATPELVQPLPSVLPARFSAPSTPSTPVAASARGRRLAVSGALATLVLAAGVAGYVQLREAGLPDLNLLPAPAAGPAARAPAVAPASPRESRS